MNAYRYSIAEDSKSGSVATRRLASEIRALPFAGDLVVTELGGEELRFSFSRKLTASEKKKLDGIVAAHDGTAPDTPDERRGGRLADLPPGRFEGQRTYASDGRKIGEEKGHGTGVPVYWSNGSWRRYSDDKPVAV